MANTVPVITIDGFSATGKSTLAQSIANHLEWKVLYSGMLYRYVAYLVLDGVIDVGLGFDVLSDKMSIYHSLTNMSCLRTADGNWDVRINGVPLRVNLQDESIAKKAADLAKNQQLRSILLPIQRAYRQGSGLIAEGRDMYSVVFPDASIPVYLTASETARASRRQTQLQTADNFVKIGNISEALSIRDAQDKERTIATLQSRGDVLVIDTTNITAKQVFELVLGDSRMTAIRGLN